MKKSTRKLALVVICACLLAAMASCAMAEGTYTVTVDGTAVNFPDQQPYVNNDRVMVPVRAPMEAMGATVTWNNETQSVTLTQRDITAIFTVGSTTYTVNGEQFTMDVAPEAVNNRVAFPIRYCVEALEGTVTWDEATSTVAITTFKVALTGQTLEVAAENSGQTLDMNVGDVAIITLDSNPSTGFLWVFKANPDESCINVTEDYIQPETDAVGAAGQQRWTITATKPGTVGIEINYARPSDTIPETTFTLTLNIADAAPAVPEEAEYTLADSGKIATLKMGERMLVALESNPSTGYYWDFTQEPDAAVVTWSDVQYEPGPDVPGAPGTERWVFDPVAPGTTTFELAYSQPGSTEVPDKFMSMTVIVNE